MLSKFQEYFHSEMPKTWVYHWVVAVFLAKSIKHPFLNEISYAQNSINPLQTVNVNG